MPGAFRWTGAAWSDGRPITAEDLRRNPDGHVVAGIDGPDAAGVITVRFSQPLPFYVEKGILSDDPFRVLDATGVGKLVRMAVADGRRVRPDLKVGICGEHGGDPRSVKLCHELGLNYVSCSPFRVPIARLAAAQAALASPPSAAISHRPAIS